MEKEPTNGPMGENTLATGWTTKCMDTESSPGPMAKNTKVNTYKIKKKDTVNLHGLTAKNIGACGQMGYSMEMGLSSIIKDHEKECGKMDEEFDGLTRKINL